MRKYTSVRQQDMTDCAPACLATILHHYGLRLPLAEIREVTKTDKEGTNVLGIIRAAEHFRLTAIAIRASKEALFDVNLIFPIIAHIVREGKLLHYVVIHEVNEKYVIAGDPAEGIVNYNHDDFEKCWTGTLILFAPKEDFQQGNKTKGFIKRVLPLLLPNKKSLFSIIILSTLITLAGIVSSFYYKYLIDDILNGQLKDQLQTISILFGIVILVKVSLQFLRSYLENLLSQKIDWFLVIEYFKHIMKLPIRFFERRSEGEVLSRLFDSHKIRETIFQSTISLVLDIMTLFVATIILFIHSTKLFLLTLTMIPLYILIVWSFNQSFKKLKRQQMEKNAELTGFLIENLTGVRAIKEFTAENHVITKTENKFSDVLKVIFNLENKRNLQFTLESFLILIGELVLLWIGGNEVIHGRLTIGELITFNTILIFCLQPLQNLIKLHPSIQEGLVAMDRLWDIMDLEAESSGSEHIKLRHIKGNIKFENVSFRYGNRELILRNLNLVIQSGERVAIVGESGSGKSTLAKLLLSYYDDLEDGNIFIDGYPLSTLDKEQLRNRMAYVPQEIYIFSGSIRDNIIMGQEKITEEQMIHAAKQAQIHEFIDKLEFGYETRVGENGILLSGGQKQRIAIARALIKEPDILILDEATSHLDSITEKILQDNIHNLSQNNTTIIIAHRFSTIMRCNRIIVIKEGSIVETGSHDELIRQEGYYFSLWKEQMP